MQKNEDVQGGQQPLRESIRVFEQRIEHLNHFGGCCSDITSAQCHALVEIGRASHSVTSLSVSLKLDKSTVSRTVEQLTQKGYVERYVNKADRRLVTIGMTEAGQILFEKIERDMNVKFESIQDRLSSKELANIIEALKILNRVMEEEENV